MSDIRNPFLRGQYAAQAANTQADQAELNGLATLLKLKQAQEEQPLRMDVLRGQIADREGLARFRDAQIAELQRKAVLAGQQQAAQGGLAQLLAQPFQGVQGQGAPAPTSVAMNEAEALRQVQEAEAQGRPARVDVPNPGIVQGLAVAADPARAILEILRQQRPEKPLNPRQQFTPVAGGYLDPQGQFVRTAPEPTRAPEPLVPILGPDRKPVLVPRSEAVGKAPASLSGREDDHMVRRVQQFSQAVEKTGLPMAYATLEEAASKITPEVLPYLTGPALAIPDIALSNKVTAARQALQRMQNIELKERSGAAVTESEYQRFKKEAGVGFLKKPEQVTEWLGLAKRVLDKHYQSVGAGFPEEVRNRYFEEAGRVTPFGSQGGGRPAGPAVGTVQGGYRFKGGDPGSPASWEQVQ